MSTFIPAHIAEEILTLVTATMEQNGTVCGEDGIIVAASVKERVGTKHEGAARIMRGEADEVAITPEQAAVLQGARPGYNCPIILDNRRIGTIGLTGDPALVRGATRLAAQFAAAAVKSGLRNQQLAEQVTGSLYQVAAASEQVKGGSGDLAGVGQSLTQATDVVVARVQDSARLLGLISGIADRIKLLGINAAIEAAHAGGHGASFSVLAQEIRRLADSSTRSVQEIRQVFDQLTQAIQDLKDGVSATSRIASEQATAVGHISDRLQQIKQSMTSLARDI